MQSVKGGWGGCWGRGFQGHWQGWGFGERGGGGVGGLDGGSGVSGWGTEFLESALFSS